MAAEAASGKRLIVADAIRDADLVTLGQAVAGKPLLTGGSGIALGLPGVYRAAGLLADVSGVPGQSALQRMPSRT